MRARHSSSSKDRSPIIVVRIMGTGEGTGEEDWDSVSNWAGEDWVFLEVENTIRSIKRMYLTRGATTERC